MIETLDLSGVYEVERKAEFLEKYDNLNTKRAFVRVFRNTFDMEKDLGKDFCFFTKEEIDQFFETTSPTTEMSARSYGRIIVQYLQWAEDEKIIDEHPLPVQQHYFLRYVKRNEEEYLTMQELNYYTEMYFKNLQDSIILELLFFGVQGKEGSELTNLKVTDLNFENHTMELFDDLNNVKRTIQLEDNRLLRLCEMANKEHEYIKRNGEIEQNPRIRPYADLFMDTPYVLKNSKSNTIHENQTTKFTLYNRLKNIQKFEEIVPIKNKMAIKNIVKSGQLYMASKLYEKYGELELTQIRMICEHFGRKVHWSIRDYLNEENLFKLYPHVKKYKKN